MTAMELEFIEVAERVAVARILTPVSEHLPRELLIEATIEDSTPLRRRISWSVAGGGVPNGTAAEFAARLGELGLMTARDLLVLDGSAHRSIVTASADRVYEAPGYAADDQNTGTPDGTLSSNVEHYETGIPRVSAWGVHRNATVTPYPDGHEPGENGADIDAICAHLQQAWAALIESDQYSETVRGLYDHTTEAELDRLTQAVSETDQHIIELEAFLLDPDPPERRKKAEAALDAQRRRRIQVGERLAATLDVMT